MQHTTPWVKIVEKNLKALASGVIIKYMAYLSTSNFAEWLGCMQSAPLRKA